MWSRDSGRGEEVFGLLVWSEAISQGQKIQGGGLRGCDQTAGGLFEDLEDRLAILTGQVGIVLTMWVDCQFPPGLNSPRNANGGLDIGS